MSVDKSWSADASGARTSDSSAGSLRLSELTTEPTVWVTANPPPLVTVSAPLPHEMVGEIVQLARTVGRKLVQDMQTSSSTLDYISSTHDIHVFQSVQPPTASIASEQQSSVPLLTRKKCTLGSISRSIWSRITRRRRRSGSRARSGSRSRALSKARRAKPAKQQPLKSSTHVPRIVGASRVHASLDELIEIVGHRSAHAASQLHPSMQQIGRHHTLVDTHHEYAGVRSMTLRTPSRAPTPPRDFLVVEHHHAFDTPTGRRGYAVACHSVHWDECPPPSVGAVRGSLFESGLTAIESESEPETVELFCVAEMNLKGGATEAENAAASHHRVVGTLARITQTIEERANMLLSLGHSALIQSGRLTSSHGQTCFDCKKRLGKQSGGIEPYACRACYAKVCEDCSFVSQQNMRLCRECGADAERTRTCSWLQRPSECPPF